MNVEKVLDALMADVHSRSKDTVTDRVLADAMVRGAGYMKFTSEGNEHVPYDDVHIAPSSDQPSGDA